MQTDESRAQLLRGISTFDATQIVHVVQTAVKSLFDALKQDRYPIQDFERVFGIEMTGTNPSDLKEYSSGTLVYLSWTVLYKNSLISEQKLVESLLHGNLPEFFKMNVISAYAEFKAQNKNVRYMTYHLLELINRDFADIHWDIEMHTIFSRYKANQSASGPSNQPNPPPIPNPNRTVLGLRIEGDSMRPEQIQIDNSFEIVPIAAAARIPLFVKMLPEPGRACNHYIICRMMSQPSIGLASPRWSFGGCLGVAPPVHMARSDGIAFEPGDWNILDGFEDAMLDDGPRPVTREDFITYILDNTDSDSMSNIVLEVRFPKNSQYRIEGLQSNVTLNGRIGIAIGFYDNKRVAIKVDEKVFKIKPVNLIEM